MAQDVPHARDEGFEVPATVPDDSIRGFDRGEVGEGEVGVSITINGLATIRGWIGDLVFVHRENEGAIAQRPGQGGSKIAGGEHSRCDDRVRIQKRKGRFPSPTHSIPDQLAEAKRSVSESPFRAAAGKGEEVPPHGAVMLDRPPDRSMRTGVPGFEGEDPCAHGPESTGGAEKNRPRNPPALS